MEEKIKYLIAINDMESLHEVLCGLNEPCFDRAILSALSYAIHKNNSKLFNLICDKFITSDNQIDINHSSGDGLNALALTVMQNNIPFFKRLLELGALPCAPIERNISNMNMDLREKSAECDTIRMSPFSIMIDLGRVEMVNLAKKNIDKKERLNQALRVIDKKTALPMVNVLLEGCESFIAQEFMCAVEENNPILCEALIKTGKIKTFDFKNKEGKTPLIVAVQKEALAVMDVIKDAVDAKKATVTVDMAVDGTNALNEACVLNNPWMVKKLLFMGASFDAPLGVIRENEEQKQFNETPLLRLVERVLFKKENAQKMVALASSVVDEVQMSSLAVKIASFLNTEKVYNVLLKNKYNLSDMAQFGISMTKAAASGDVDLVSFLMQRHVSPLDEFAGKTAVLEAAKAGQTDVLRLFLDELSLKKMETPIQGITAFETAVWHGHEKAALILLRSGIKPVTHFKTGESVLMRAVDHNMGFLIEELLLKEPELKDSQECKKALWTAVRLKRNMAVKGFCWAKSDLIFKSIDGTSLFHWAVKNKNYDAMLDLYKAGVDVDGADMLARTALHTAVLNKDQKACHMLLLMGAYRKAKDVSGVTPYMLAKQTGLDEVTSLMFSTARERLRLKREQKLRMEQRERN